MSRRDKIIDHLEMMGYVVEDLPKDRDIVVKFQTDSGYGCFVKVSYEACEEDFVIEHIVESLNQHIKKNL